ncbi:DENN domain-containing protein 1B isoform X2 [Rhineura floridana]|uniref:DENN domain-containing protein 1B isoform X2 n=1 Tax=Rhineura floridana TaxID=261503 RepID=UPI002AC80226|nr:DENN domain-containing protein 1B isoform X2 [Rhineura floridana]
MDCRIKENPKSTFDLVLQVKCQASENEDPVVLWKFPEDFGDKEVLLSVSKFCFPFDTARVTQVGQHFTFVLTDIESKQRFGFCRLTSAGKVCLCILSYLPWFEVYYKLLNTLADYLSKGQEDDLNDLLETWYSHPVPEASTPISLNLHSYFITPDLTGLPTVPESRNLTEYFVAVDVNNMLQLYASMLHERRIIITSSKLSTLTACIHGSAALLYPMYWQHIYIPVLPPHLLDYCCAPMPYLIGIHFSLMERVKSKSLEDVVMLNVDTNTLETPFNDLSNIPSEVVSALKNKLKKQSTATGDGVARAFLRAQAALFGSYRDALRYKPGEPVSFCEESFVKHRSSTTKQFLETAVNLQLFKQFIEGRLAKLNAGKVFSDVFEEEISSGGFSGGNSRSYHQWMYTVKKGGALINTAMNRASPAMKTAYQYAKNHAKQGIKEVRNKLKHKETEDEYGTCSLGFVQYTPVYTLHNPPRLSTEKRRLAQTRLGHLHTNMLNHDSALDDADDEMDRGSKLSSEDSEETSCYLYDSDDSGEMAKTSAPPGEMDLLGEILDTLSTHSSDQGKLSGAKSLDFFRSMDNIDYKIMNKSNTPSESNLALLCGGQTSDPADWNLGQDDSILSGRQLPPSPRKRVPSSGYRESLFMLNKGGFNHTCSADNVDVLKTHTESPSPYQEAMQLCSPAVFQVKKTRWNETLSSISTNEMPPNLSQNPSTLVPWERETRKENEILEEGGLLHEVVSLCKMTSAFNHGLNISGDRFSSSSGNKA